MEGERVADPETPQVDRWPSVSVHQYVPPSASPQRDPREQLAAGRMLKLPEGG